MKYKGNSYPKNVTDNSNIWFSSSGERVRQLNLKKLRKLKIVLYLS